MAKDQAVEGEVEDDRIEDNHESKRNRNNQSKKREALTRFIPIEIVACILARLPAKAVGRCRCVCRRWLSLTRDARFIADHHRLGGTYRLLLPQVHGILLHEVGPNCGEIDGGGPHLKLPADVFSNPVNGLVCMLGRTTTPVGGGGDGPCSVVAVTVTWGEPCLLNPVTRETLQLPRNPEMDRHCARVTGLGFDASRGEQEHEYKLVTFKNKAHMCDGGRFATCMVLTVGTGGWRSIGDAPCTVWSRPVFLDGAIRWLASELTSDRRRLRVVMLAFDVKDETFRLIPAPDAISNIANPLITLNLSLRTLRGRVCVVHVLHAGPPQVDSEPLSTVIWMLRGSPNHNHGWVLDCEIPTPFWWTRTRSRELRVVGVRGEKVLMHSQNAIYSYDLLTKIFNPLYLAAGFLYETGVTADSLFSPRNL